MGNYLFGKRFLIIATCVVSSGVLLAACAPNRNEEPEIILPTSSPSETYTPEPTKTSIPPQTIEPTPTPEIFVPIKESIAFLPGDDNMMGGTIDIGPDANLAYEMLVTGIINGHAEVEIDGQLIRNDDLIKKYLGVDPNNYGAVMEALANHKSHPDDSIGYFMPELILPVDSSLSQGGGFELGIIKDLRLDVLLWEILNEEEFLERTLRQDGQLKPEWGNSDYVTSAVIDPVHPITGIVFGVDLQEYEQDGFRFNRYIMRFGTTQPNIWIAVGVQPTSSKAASFVNKWTIEFYAHLFDNMEKFSDYRNSKVLDSRTFFTNWETSKMTYGWEDDYIWNEPSEYNYFVPK